MAGAGHLRPLGRSLVLVARAAPRELLRLSLLNLAFGAGPAVILLLSKVVIDEVARLVQDGTGTGPGEVFGNPTLLWSVVAFVVINVLLDSAETLAGLEIASLRDRLAGRVKWLIYDKVANFEDIALFEDPERLNTLVLAEQSIPKLQRMALTLGNLLTGLFVLIPVLVLSATLVWWVPVVIFVTAIPSIWVQLRYEEIGWSVERAQAGSARRMSLLGRVFTGPEYAKELRLFRLQPHLLGGWRSLFWSTFAEMRRVRKRGALLIAGWSLIGGLGAGLPYVYVVSMAAQGRLSLGDLALYAGLVFEMRRSLYVLVGNAADLQEIALGSSAVFRLLDLQPQLTAGPGVPAGGADGAGDPGRRCTLEVRGVSFSYPGDDRRVLTAVDLSARTGEMVVIVGENGAGKTTLAKLLCRLYDPQEGAIRWCGTDIRALDLAAWRDRIAMVNQDYARFPATVRENIGFGQVSALDDQAAIEAAADRAGLRPAIRRWPAGLDTPLSKQLEAGVEPSGGQWQRIGIARALVRHHTSDLLILDEPTASLDAKAEYEIFRILRAMARDKIAIVISHRLALARTAHRIVVMEHGRVVETGTHDELMAAGALYHALFTRQASSYTAADEKGVPVGD
jgi:ATP-binding cassette subfamily B protein